jgi:hypothetical protein
MSVHVAKLEEAWRAPKPPGSPIEVVNASQVTRPYKVVGIVSVDQGLGDAKDQDIIDRLKEEARKLGGDAVMGLVGQQDDAQLYGVSKVGSMFLPLMAPGARKFSCQVLVWLDEDVPIGAVSLQNTPRPAVLAPSAPSGSDADAQVLLDRRNQAVLLAGLDSNLEESSLGVVKAAHQKIVSGETLAAQEQALLTQIDKLADGSITADDYAMRARAIMGSESQSPAPNQSPAPARSSAQPRSPGVGTISYPNLPARIRVLVDGRPVNLPAQVSVGTHMVRMERAGYAPVQSQIEVAKGRDVRLVPEWRVSASKRARSGILLGAVGVLFVGMIAAMSFG